MQTGFIVTGAWIIFIAYWAYSAIGAKKTIGGGWRDPKGIMIRLIAAVATIVLLVLVSKGVAPFGSLKPLLRVTPSPVALAIADVLVIAGIALAIWARVHLGRNWGMPMSLKESPELVTSGPYKLIRHPIYSGMLLAFLGTAIATGLIWILVLVWGGIYFIYSARTEEKIMANRFPDIYPEYKQRTKMIVPFIF
ncbi:MAG: isoprenylcysteine carboxylmethyltransferase family protein [Patescibacteria group bacterium]|nr:isoprenylcysteine carboxylmethyltransferase family protein [Patescibacteria group bacterium]MDE2116270.1 isoprenylcysteine carboxylmethyltransferase family protein [Patescibacteria group bacterium]